MSTLVSQKHRLNGRTLSSFKLLCLASTTNTTVEPPERNDLLVVGNVEKVGVGLGQLKTCVRSKIEKSVPAKVTTLARRTSKSSRNLPHIFEVSPQVLAASAGGYSTQSVTHSCQFNLTWFLHNFERTFFGVRSKGCGGVAN